MSRYGIDLYASLEAETVCHGLETCGSLNVAKTPERLTLFKRQMARAKSFGIEFEFISAADAGRLVPILRTDDLAGACGFRRRQGQPTDLTQSLAKGARMNGATITRASGHGVTTGSGRVTGVAWKSTDDEGTIVCETLVNCAGQWARAFGQLAGVTVPLYAAEPFTS